MVAIQSYCYCNRNRGTCISPLLEDRGCTTESICIHIGSMQLACLIKVHYTVVASATVLKSWQNESEADSGMTWCILKWSISEPIYNEEHFRAFIHHEGRSKYKRKKE